MPVIQPNINYSRIAEAVDYYGRKHVRADMPYHKYEYIEVPWLVSAESNNVTKPAHCRAFDTFMGQLVASGEQSFLEVREDLCPGRRYMCVTPCFRDDKIDNLHLPYFMKLELIHVLWKTDDAMRALQDMMYDALYFFKLKVSGPACPQYEPKRVQTDIGYDIEIEGIEVGSYGVREHNGFRWVYGTGLAEPRASYVWNLLHEAKQREEDELMAEISK